MEIQSRVGTGRFGKAGKAPSVVISVDFASVELIWDTHQGEFIVRRPFWSDGRVQLAPEFSPQEWEEIFTEANRIRKVHGW